MLQKQRIKEFCLCRDAEQISSQAFFLRLQYKDNNILSKDMFPLLNFVQENISWEVSEFPRSKFSITIKEFEILVLLDPA